MTSIDHSQAGLGSPARGSLQHLPLPLFAVPMGLGGLALAWRDAAVVLGAPVMIGEALMAVAAIAWLVILVAHATRTFLHPSALAGDLVHPIRSAFAGAISIGLLILSGGAIPYSTDLAAGLWLTGVSLHLVVGVWIVRSLLLSPRDAATLTPPLLIPLVGNVLAPIFGAKLGFVTASWMLFGLGALLWLIVQPLILLRLATGPQLPARMRPTLAILLAPPAVGSIALAALTGGFGPGPLAVYALAALIAVVLLTLVPVFRTVPFAMSWWGYTFPAAAFSIASLKVAHHSPMDWHGPALWVLLVFVSGVIATVSIATLKALWNGHLLQPE
ncbi:SLAC1 anion channel family protein [Rhizobium sp. SL86]|uniref:SLAC1 anion channel family protein n=1 Tax=Rhizobium sp. SL86 TaxID=2995148 RepID=UPI002272DB43|nr:SLAC1 anion channel family protein [Rhizobium sp. SL86]MCY1668220.1 SLAC1 anion channel family protein [Rhizobium sp. SL86]